MSDKKKVIILLALLTLFIFYTLYIYQPALLGHTTWNQEIDAGKRLWQEKNCNSCHQVYGLGGFLGPDLTNVYSQRSETHIKAFIQSGTGIMPAFNLSEGQLSQLLAYLKSMDESGVATPHSFKIKYDGTIER